MENSIKKISLTFNSCSLAQIIPRVPEKCLTFTVTLLGMFLSPISPRHRPQLFPLHAYISALSQCQAESLWGVSQTGGYGLGYVQQDKTVFLLPRFDQRLVVSNHPVSITILAFDILVGQSPFLVKPHHNKNIASSLFFRLMRILPITLT